MVHIKKKKKKNLKKKKSPGKHLLSSILKSLSITWHRAVATKHCVPSPVLSISPASPPSELTTSPEDRTTMVPTV